MVSFISADEAASLIKDGITLGIGGFGGFSAPDEILKAIAKRYAAQGAPSALNVVCGISPGDLKENGWGLSIIKAPGIVSSIYAAHVGMSPAIGRAVTENRIAAFVIPLGVYGHLLKAIAGKEPGIITKVGLYTFADPRLEGCRINGKACASEREVVSLVKIDGADYLFYRSFSLDACIIRGTYADQDGNISMEQEAVYSEQLEMASAVHNNGGIVIAQVREIQEGPLDPRKVRVHNSLVDYVVKAAPQNHLQCYDGSPFRPELIGETRVKLQSLSPMPMGPRKICGRRGALELRSGSLINVGIGTPDSVASVANEEGIVKDLTFSVETGLLGGVPVGGVGMGASVNPEVMYNIADNFDLYDGGILDMAFLGAAEIDEEGNVNVSKFGPRCTGPGGFINISQNTKQVCFMGTFTAGGLQTRVDHGRLVIEQDGRELKFKKKVEQVTFSARYARENAQRILYITERAVFTLVEEGIMLTEIAPGIDLERDVLAKMEFVPLLADNLKLMDEHIFHEMKMGLSLSK